MLLSKKELAKYFGVSTKTIERKIAEGLLSHYFKIGKVLRFDEESINELLKNCRHNKEEARQ